MTTIATTGDDNGPPASTMMTLHHTVFFLASTPASVHLSPTSMIGPQTTPEYGISHEQNSEEQQNHLSGDCQKSNSHTHHPRERSKILDILELCSLCVASHHLLPFTYHSAEPTRRACWPYLSKGRVPPHLDRVELRGIYTSTRTLFL